MSIESINRRLNKLDAVQPAETPRRIAAQHIGHEKIEVAIAVDIREIHPHRKMTRMPHRQIRHRAKIPLPIVQPNAVG